MFIKFVKFSYYFHSIWSDRNFDYLTFHLQAFKRHYIAIQNSDESKSNIINRIVFYKHQ